jgi:hypothetical protein
MPAVSQITVVNIVLWFGSFVAFDGLGLDFFHQPDLAGQSIPWLVRAVS